MLRRALLLLPKPCQLQCQAISSSASTTYKASTGIVGLEADPNARQNLTSKLQEVLQAIRVIPEHAEYRKNVETTMKHKLQVVQSEVPDEDAEDQLEAQLEQVMKMCDEEMRLIPKMAEWQPWDVPSGHKVEVIEEQEVPDKTTATQVPGQPKK